MDRRFLDFWKKAFLNAAQGIEQAEAFSRWMEQGMKGAAEFTEQFQKAYGLSQFTPSSDDAKKLWENASADFKNSYQALLDGMGLISREKYATCLKKCEELEALVARQEEEISRLKMRLSAEATGESVKRFAGLMENQALQFQKTVDAMGKFLGQDKTKRKD